MVTNTFHWRTSTCCWKAFPKLERWRATVERCRNQNRCLEWLQISWGATEPAVETLLVRVKSMGRKAIRVNRHVVAVPLVVFTIGHSTRTSEDFIRLLKAHCVERLVDVRTVPRSRHNPQFNRAQLSPAMHRSRIHYRYMPGLGGFRHARRDSTNTGWHNASFRGYADYMQTPEFRENLDALIGLAQHERIAIMCAEAVPWRCHRSLIADALLARGIEVREITGTSGSRLHSLTPWARIEGTEVSYPGEPSSLEPHRKIRAPRPTKSTSKAAAPDVGNGQKGSETMTLEFKLIEGIGEKHGRVSPLKNAHTRQRRDDARLVVPDDGHGSGIRRKSTPRRTFK